MSQNTRQGRRSGNSSSSTAKKFRIRKIEDVVIVGLTGGIGSGQSTVATELEKLGAKTLSADLVAKKIVDNDPEVRQEIKAAFGKSVLTRRGRINRQLLAKAVFNDPRKTARLNKIVHPRMVANIIEQIEKWRESKRYPLIVLDAALIFEIQLEQMFDQIIVVNAQKRKRIERVIERDGLEEADILDRMQRQIPLSEKVKWADIVIHNNGNIEQLAIKVEKTFDKLLETPVAPKGRKPSRRNSRKAKTTP